MLEVVKYLKSFGVDKLKENFGIDINDYNDRLVLNYGVTCPNKHHQIVKECRGLILSKPHLDVLSRPFDRFFNFGEDQNSNKFDIKNAEIQEKLDGSLCIVYHDGNKWCVQTRKMAFAEGQVNYGKYKFYELFEKALGKNIQDAFKDGCVYHSYIFELISPFNKVVKDYFGFHLYLLGIRSKVDGYEWSLNKDKLNYLEQTKSLQNCVKLPKIYHFKNIDEVKESMNDLQKDDEGYVAVNIIKYGFPWRIKIKNPSYIALARLKNGINYKRIIELVFEQDYEELLIAFPEYKDEFEKYQIKYDKIINEINDKWNEVKDVKDQKEFALRVKNLPYCGVLFNMKKEYNSPYHYLNKLSLNGKIKLIGD